MGTIQQPITQVRLTNVAVVRLKKNGIRFEIACYRNKVLSWREGNEKDLDEVLQVESVFSNVSKGTLAKSKDLKNAFGTENVREICIHILEKGDLQVSDKERSHQHDKLFNEIALIVTNKCVDPNTKRPYTVGMIERAMKETLHYAVVPSRSAKQQALEVIKQLQQHMDLERAQMRLHVTIPTKQAKQTTEKLQEYVVEWEQEDFLPSSYEAICLIDPGSFRKIDEILKSETKGKGTLEVVDLAVVYDQDEIIH